MQPKKIAVALAAIAMIGVTTLGVLNLLLGEDAVANEGATCPVGTVDCVDADLGDDRIDGETLDALEQQARAVLGTYQEDLPSDVRIGRIGDEHMMLTEDHVIGRLTVGLDDLDGSGLRVVDVTVELPNGSATYTLQAG